jgi:hypothetical protein
MSEGFSISMVVDSNYYISFLFNRLLKVNLPILPNPLMATFVIFLKVKMSKKIALIYAKIKVVSHIVCLTRGYPLLTSHQL